VLYGHGLIDNAQYSALAQYSLAILKDQRKY
jgi:hypothetical protein